MPGSVDGGRQAGITNKQRYGKDFYQKIGAKGGLAKTDKPKGFAAMSREERSAAGRKGGLASRRVRWSRKAYLTRVQEYAQKHQENA